MWLFVLSGRKGFSGCWSKVSGLTVVVKYTEISYALLDFVRLRLPGSDLTYPYASLLLRNKIDVRSLTRETLVGMIRGIHSRVFVANAERGNKRN